MVQRGSEFEPKRPQWASVGMLEKAAQPLPVYDTNEPLVALTECLLKSLYMISYYLFKSYQGQSKWSHCMCVCVCVCGLFCVLLFD